MAFFTWGSVFRYAYCNLVPLLFISSIFSDLVHISQE
jgi:hypothetical protein